MAEAERCVQQAFETFRGTGSQNGMGYVHLDLAVLAHDRGDAAEVRRHLDLARNLFTALDAPRYVERVDALAEQLAGPPDSAAPGAAAPLSPPSGR